MFELTRGVTQMKKFANKIAPISIAALAILGLTAPGASALGEAPTSSANVNEPSNVNLAETQAANPTPDMPEPEEGSVFDTVANASDTDEQRAILEAEGFEATTGPNGEEQYEQTVDGVTIGWTIEPDTEQDGISPMWSIGWQNGPYVAATSEQWQNAAVNAGTIGGAACVFITATLGAAGCVAAAGVVTNHIGNMDSAPNDCWAYYGPFNTVPVLPSNNC